MSGNRFAAPDPVFVDPSGRRRRLITRMGIGISLLGAAYGMALLVLTLVGVHVQAPGLPFLEHLPRVSSGRSDDHLERSTHVPSATRSAAAVDPRARQPAAVATNRRAAMQPTSDPQPGSSAGPGTSPGHPSAAASSAAASAASPSAVPSPSTQPSSTGTASAGPTAGSKGKSAEAPGAANRPTAKPTPAKDKSADPPGASHRPTHQG